MGSYFMSITRGLISVCVPIEDLGKIFAFISTLDGLSPMVMSQIYASIWKVGNFAGYTISILMHLSYKIWFSTSKLIKSLYILGIKRNNDWGIFYVFGHIANIHSGACCHNLPNVERSKLREHNCRRRRKRYSFWRPESQAIKIKRRNQRIYKLQLSLIQYCWSLKLLTLSVTDSKILPIIIRSLVKRNSYQFCN